MSLINRVLQDLDKRGAEPSSDSHYAGEVRPVATQNRNKRRTTLLWLLAVCGVVVLALAVWPGTAAFKDFPAGLWAGPKSTPPVTNAAIPARQPQPVESVKARVEAALMVPVVR